MLSVTPVPVVIDELAVECVHCYKYLGVWLDDKLSFNMHVDAQIKKANKRVYCFRTLYKLHVDSDIMVMYNATLASLLMCAVAALYGTAT